MTSRKSLLALTFALCGTIGLTIAGSNSIGIDTSKPFLDKAPPQPKVETADTSHAEVTKLVVASADEAAISGLTGVQQPDIVAVEHDPIVVASLGTPNISTTLLFELLGAEAPFVPVPSEETASYVQILDECFVLEVCVDHYLWELYQRTAKLDTSKVHVRQEVKIKRKGKIVTVTKRIMKLVDQDFTWKDPHAAGKVGMSMMDYVIGGMDRDFKLRLYQALRAAEKEGLAPGITSGFRDDYRQSIASGLKAASNRSYHGGSLRGGYGHGVAADVVSTKGATRAQRWITTVALWKWIDANEHQFGIGRPYLSKDPPHVAPIDGEEYASRRGTKVQVAAANAKQAAQPVNGSAKASQAPAVRAQRPAPSAKAPVRTNLAVAKRR